MIDIMWLKWSRSHILHQFKTASLKVLSYPPPKTEVLEADVHYANMRLLSTFQKIGRASCSERV